MNQNRFSNYDSPILFVNWICFQLTQQSNVQSTRNSFNRTLYGHCNAIQSSTYPCDPPLRPNRCKYCYYTHSIHSRLCALDTPRVYQYQASARSPHPMLSKIKYTYQCHLFGYVTSGFIVTVGTHFACTWMLLIQPQWIPISRCRCGVCNVNNLFIRTHVICGALELIEELSPAALRQHYIGQRCGVADISG